MTMPNPYTTPAEAAAARVDALHGAGHGWMPPDMQQTLASSATSDPEMLTIADHIRQSLSTVWNGFTEATDDPVLHKEPTAALALTRYLTASLGPLPVAEGDLHEIQRNLQKQGFGGDLQISGVWGPDWNAAYSDWASTLKAKQLAGNKPGSVGTAKAAHSIWDALSPSHAFNSLVGYAEGIPDALRHAAGSLVAGSDPSTWWGDVKTGTVIGHADPVASQDAATVRNLLGDHVTPEQVASEGTAGIVEDIGTLLSLMPVGRAATGASRAALGEWAKGVSQEAAARGPGVIAKSFYGGLGKKQLETVTGDVTRNELRRGVLNSNVVRNIPLLGQVGPVVGKLADADGMYYRARTLLATPYKLPAVRAAGEIGQRTMLTGAAVNLAAQAEQGLGVGNDMSANVLNNKTLSTIDMNVQRITGTPFHHPFTHAVDALGYVLHGPLGSTRASTVVGDHVQAVTDGMSDFLGRINAHGMWELATEKATGTRTSVEDLQAAFGGPEKFDRFVSMKLADLSAAHHAQNGAQTEGLAHGTQEYRDRVGQLADEVWANPDLHHNAIRELLADPYEVANRVAADMLHNSFDAKSYAADGLKWMQAGDHLTNVVRTGMARFMFGGDGKTVIGNAQDAFDYGLGQDSPVRLLGTTRRDYVHQVTTGLSRARRQVDQTRTTLGQAVADAETAVQQAQETFRAAPVGNRDEQLSALRSATSSLRQVKGRQQQFEAALESGNVARFVQAAKKIAGPGKTAGQWDRFHADLSQVRRLVDQAVPSGGERLSFNHLLDTGVNPDELYTNINGEPRHAVEAIGSGDWMREHLPHADGALGLGRVDTKSAQEASADIARFRQQLEKATPADTANVVEQMKAYGFREFGMDERTLGIWDGNPTALAEKLDEQAHRLASEVFLTSDAPAELHGELARIKDLGYRPMLGSHIGHMWDGSLPPMPELEGAISRRRRFAGALGVNPDQITPRTAGQDASIRVLRNVGRALEDPKARIPARTTAETVMQVLRDRDLVHTDMKLPEKLVVTATRKAHKAGIEQLAKDRGIVDMKEAAQQYEAEMSRALQLRDIPRADFLKALTEKGQFSNGATWEGMDRRTANLVRSAVLSGYADRPGYIMGLGHLEDWFRGGFTVGNKLAVTFPESELVQRAAELPNALVNVRNRLRFTLSPYFDFRRVAKQNYKMGLDGVSPVLNPLAHMVNRDTFTKAHKYLDTLIGNPQTAGFDDADRYLHQQSVWGLYNSRHYEAYYAWEKHLAGETDDEIRQGIRRVFEYGSSRTGGRSALERTVNTIFFPFSFEKTLLRNTGAYMINHPQQALLLTGAMTAYDEANKNEHVHKWMSDHLPLARDIEKLNAFAHGISPGELGGINAPLLNLFMPQQWGHQFSKKNLKRLLPVWNDFGQLLADTRDQARIGYSAVRNAGDFAISAGHRDPLDPYRPTITPQAQVREAQAMRNHAIIVWAPVLDYNAHVATDAEKYTFPDDPRLPMSVRGKVVNRATIGNLVHVWFPAYRPGDAQKYAADQADKAQKYVDGIVDPVKRQQYGVFVKLAAKVQGHLQQGDYGTATAAATMQQFRTVAVAAAEKDSSFLRFYREHYRWLFGPIEKAQG